MSRIRLVGAALIIFVVASCSDYPEESALAPSSQAAQPSSTSASRGTLAAPAAYSLPSTADVEEVVRQTLAHHPSLKSLRAQAEALDEASRQARFLPDPSAAIGAGRMAETAAGRVNGTVGVQQKIPFPGKRSAQAAILQHQAEAIRAQLKSEELILAEQVRRAWWSYYLATETSGILAENREILSSLQTTIEAKIATNKATQQDYLKAENEVTKITQRLAGTRGQADSARASLNALLSRPHQSSLPRPTVPAFRLYGPASSLISAASSRHPEVLVAQAKIEAARSLVSLTSLNGRPDFTAGAAWTPVSDDGLAPSANGEDQFMATVGVTLPFSGEKNKAGRRQAASTLAASQENLATTLSLIQQRIGSAHASFTSEREAQALYPARLIPDAKQVFELTLTSYQAGNASFLEVIDSWRQLLSYELQALESRTRLGQAEAALMKAAGLR